MVVILAQCGSYVPAEGATIPIRDRLCCRIGYADDTEHNLSTFMLEMKETAFICNHANENSLILIDELGRATSNEEGIAIAWSVSEFLLTTGATTFFVSHYPLLARLAEMYPAVQNVSLEATILRNESTEITYSHKVKAGPCSACKDYGVEMAAYCGWPQEVIENARIIEKEVESLLPSHDVCDEGFLQAAKQKQFHMEKLVSEACRSMKTLLQRNENQELLVPSNAVRLALTAIRSNIVDAVDFDVEDEMKEMKHLLTERDMGKRKECLANGRSIIEEKDNSLSEARIFENAKNQTNHDGVKSASCEDDSASSCSSASESLTESSGENSLQ
jgi:DNA mismatch repair ATPase MutS